MGEMMPWENMLNTAPEIPVGVMAAMPSKVKPMWLTDE